MDIAVLGAGSWGTTIAVTLNRNGHKVSLLTHKKEDTEEILKENENKRLLPGIKLSKNILITHEMETALKDAQMVVVAVPSIAVREVIAKASAFLNDNQIIVNASKGFEEATLQTLSQVIKEVVPKCRVGVLSGPVHAEELAKELTAACVDSAEDENIALAIQDAIMNSYFRVYVNNDPIGVEISAAFKNIIALAAGIADGIGYGDNAKAALMTRGAKEVALLGVAMGASENTFYGLSGLGDLIVTCTSMHSRNRRAGILLGKGLKLEEVLVKIGMVVEGVNSATSAGKLAEKYQVDMPIIKEINEVLFKGKDPKQAVEELMTREKTKE